MVVVTYFEGNCIGQWYAIMNSSKAVLVPVGLLVSTADKVLCKMGGQLPISQASVSFRVCLCFQQAEYEPNNLC